MAYKNLGSSAPKLELTASESTRLLETLCVKYGFCLPPLWRARLQKNPPHTIEKFVDTVFHAEGMGPVLADRNLYRQLLDEVRQANDRCKEAIDHRDA